MNVSDDDTLEMIHAHYIKYLCFIVIVGYASRVDSSDKNVR